MGGCFFYPRSIRISYRQVFGIDICDRNEEEVRLISRKGERYEEEVFRIFNSGWVRNRFIKE